jgi:excinuclease ABC subunit C
MLQEVLKRRFKRSSIKSNDASATDTWAILPDLVLIDGGKGQLNTALSAMREMGAGSIPVASLAKENEEIFIPQEKEPVILPGNSSALQLLQRLRDEAHRFALGYHQKIHKKQAFASVLDTIPGIGPKRKRTLLIQFGSVQAIREAPIDELATARGMSQSLAQKIKEYL